MLYPFRLRISPKQHTKDCDIVWLSHCPNSGSIVISGLESWKVISVIFVNSSEIVELCVEQM